MKDYCIMAAKRTTKGAALIVAALAVLAFASPVLAQNDATSRGDPIEEVEASDPEMNAAIAKAQETLPQLLAAMEDDSGTLTNITFKFPLEGWEHIWVENIARDGETLTGTLSNNPHADGWKLGDAVRVPIGDVSDWGYFDGDGVMQGMYTTRVLLGRIDPEQAASVKQYYGWD